MVDIQKAVNDAVKRFGMEIVEVRVRRADYPDETRSNIENRMKSEREREAKSFGRAVLKWQRVLEQTQGNKRSLS